MGLLPDASEEAVPEEDIFSCSIGEIVVESSSFDLQEGNDLRKFLNSVTMRRQVEVLQRVDENFFFGLVIKTNIIGSLGSLSSFLVILLLLL